MKMLLLVTVLLTVVVLAYRRARRDTDDDWMPSDLRGANLAYSESTFRAPRLRLVARVDRAYRQRGELHLIELKTRSRHVVYPSDVIELSAQRVAIEHSVEHSEKVSPVGTVVTMVGKKRRGHRVSLLTEAEVRNLVARREAILAGNVVPNHADRTGICHKCPYVAVCGPHQRVCGDA